MITSWLKGHIIYFDSIDWRFKDNNKKIYKRPCIKCGGKSEHDDCLGVIPNVTSACCGHGVTKKFIKEKKNET
jgi:hypothetical protein